MTRRDYPAAQESGGVDGFAPGALQCEEADGAGAAGDGEPVV